MAPVPWGELAGVRVGIVLWGGLAVLDLIRATAAPSYAGLVAVAVLVTVASVRTGTGTALVSAGIGWLLVDGFDEHKYGVLGFHAVHDLVVIALLTGLAVGASRFRR